MMNVYIITSLFLSLQFTIALIIHFLISFIASSSFYVFNCELVTRIVNYNSNMKGLKAMRKGLIVVLSAMLVLPITGCSNNTELEQLKKENEELRAAINNSGAKNPKISTVEGINDVNNAPILNLNKPFIVNTEYGDYALTFLGVETKDWRGKNADIEFPTLVISYEVENINFKSDYSAGCLIGSNFFYVYDDRKTLLSCADTRYEISNQYPDTVLPGYKGQFDECYELRQDTKYIDIVLHRTNEDGQETVVGKIQININ